MHHEGRIAHVPRNGWYCATSLVCRLCRLYRLPTAAPRTSLMQERMDVLLIRQYELLQCLDTNRNNKKYSGGGTSKRAMLGERAEEGVYHAGASVVCEGIRGLARGRGKPTGFATVPYGPGNA